MGTASSVPSRAEFAKQTRAGSDLTSRILQWLLKESNLLDLYALAAPSECRKYIAFTAKGLDKLFKEIQIEPKQSSQGKIYFQRIADLTRMPERSSKEQQETCMQISFFFIRILQIFAALSLSVLDTEIPTSDSDMNSYAIVSQPGRAPILPAQFRRVPLFTAPVASGGAIEPGKAYYIKDINYAILNRYLTKASDSLFELYDGLNKTGIMVPFERIYPVTQPTLIFKGKDTNDNVVTIRAGLQIRRSQSGLDDTVYRVLLKPVQRDGKDIERYAMDIVPRDKGSIGPVDFHSILGDEPKFKLQTLSRFIKNEFNRILGKPYDEEEGALAVVGERFKKFEALPISEIPEKLQLKSVWQALSSKPPVKAHCVARAFQLLSPEAVYGSSSGRISICDKKFAFLRQGSLPKPQGSIMESKGLLTLNLLFFDMLDKVTPTIRKETQDKYKTFLKEMKIVFEELQDSPANTEAIEAATITDTFHRVCLKNGKVIDDKLTSQDKRLLAGLRGYVGKLLLRQMKHTKDVMRLLGKLFVIGETEPLVLQPSIQERGMVEIEKIAEEVRELLNGYYKDCEITYREGVIFAGTQLQ